MVMREVGRLLSKSNCNFADDEMELVVELAKFLARSCSIGVGSTNRVWIGKSAAAGCRCAFCSSAFRRRKRLVDLDFELER